MSWLSKWTGVHVKVDSSGVHAHVDWKQLRDAAEGAVVIAANYFVPGSSILTSGLTSRGAQRFLNTTGVGVAGQLIAGGAGVKAGYGIPGVSNWAKSMGSYVNGITQSTILGDATTGAIIGGAMGGASSAAQGKDIAKGAVRGAEGGAASGAVAGALQGGTIKGWQSPVELGSSRLGQAATSAAGTYAGSEAAGSTGQQALESGLISGASTFAFPTQPGMTDEEKAKASGERQALSSALNLANAARRSTGGSALSSALASQPQGQTYSQQASPGSAALAQALRVGDAGAPIFGTSGDEKGKKSRWNVESLRSMGSES